ncbi:hypothetical protein OV079_49200 [Nannocystis pusilla]|uniref:Uncharacterized protein n=1 Tax=Nannocystis pusilla TaxID=889268 RepID=A0A9X3J231_9BACT|nr:hypothetical protein [Nannocystis pusilla]MCY1013377.1 hypothetical protein [Nannocystis pusilla]
MRSQAAADRFSSNSYDLVIEGESYRARTSARVRFGTRWPGWVGSA